MSAQPGYEVTHQLNIDDGSHFSMTKRATDRFLRCDTIALCWQWLTFYAATESLPLFAVTEREAIRTEARLWDRPSLLGTLERSSPRKQPPSTPCPLRQT